MTEPLTAEELAELRPWFESGEDKDYPWRNDDWRESTRRSGGPTDVERRLLATLAARDDGLRAALERAILRIHYAEKHGSVPLGRLITTCTDDPCPSYRAALSPTRTERPHRPSMIGRWSRGGWHAPACWQAWLDAGGEQACICSIMR